MNRLIIFLATGAGSGFFPRAPGTAGSALAVIVLFFVPDFSSSGFLFCTGLTIILGTWVASRAEDIFKKEDPSEVVIDEIAGILISVAFLPANGFTLLTAFVLFRFFDIAKPWPVRQAEEAGQWLAKKFPQNKIFTENRSGIGIMLDDILAGIYANLSLLLISSFFLNC